MAMVMKEVLPNAPLLGDNILCFNAPMGEPRSYSGALAQAEKGDAVGDETNNMITFTTMPTVQCNLTT